jgi:hypothetical protein
LFYQKRDEFLAIKSDDDDYGGQNVAVTGCKTSQPSCSPRGQMWGGGLAEDNEAPSRSKIVFGNCCFDNKKIKMEKKKVIMVRVP